LPAQSRDPLRAPLAEDPQPSDRMPEGDGFSRFTDTAGAAGRGDLAALASRDQAVPIHRVRRRRARGRRQTSTPSTARRTGPPCPMRSSRRKSDRESPRALALTVRRR
jgi:hypothetical protein